MTSRDVADLAGQPTDEFGVPVSIRHSPQTNLPVWQFIHKLASPFPNPKVPDRPHTHICVLCSADPPMRSTVKSERTWWHALMRQGMSTNAVSHLQRVHPEEFAVIADDKKRRREAVDERKNIKADPKKKRTKKAASNALKTARHGDEQEIKVGEGPEVAETAPVTFKTRQMRQRPAEKTVELVKKWLISAGLSVSVVQDDSFQKLLKLSSASATLVLPTASSLNAEVREEFSQFGAFLRSYLAEESRSALGLQFLSLCHEFRAVGDATIEDDGLSASQRKAFLSVRIGFIDSQWRRVDLALVAKEVPQAWDQQLNQLIAQTLSEMYGIQDTWNYARFQVADDESSSSSLMVHGDNASPNTKQEDHLTHTLRGCVFHALGFDVDGDTTVRRILRLLQELLKYFAAPDRTSTLQQIGATHGMSVSPYQGSLIDELALSTTSVGAVAELLRLSCARYHAYSLYFQSSMKATTAEPELETVWTQLSIDDWQTVAEIEALLNQLGQFRLEERLASRPSATAASYSLLFRRLLSVSTNTSSLKCIPLGDDTSVVSAANKRLPRRKAKRVDMFTIAGRQCLTRLRQQISLRFAAPSTSLDVDNEIKAMLLDPRISSKAASLVSDARAFQRAQESLRQEHRVIFEKLALKNAEYSPGKEEHGDDAVDSDDDEMAALLMVDGPKNQPPATLASTTTTSGRRSSDKLVGEEARAWHEWQQVYVAWDALAEEGSDLYDKGQYNLLKLYHHVDILKWFRDVGQQAHPAAALLARMYLGQQLPPYPVLEPSLQRFMKQVEADWIPDATQRAEQRCILHHNWQQYKQLNATLHLSASGSE